MQQADSSQWQQNFGELKNAYLTTTSHLTTPATYTSANLVLNK